MKKTISYLLLIILSISFLLCFSACGETYYTVTLYNALERGNYNSTLKETIGTGIYTITFVEEKKVKTMIISRLST